MLEAKGGKGERVRRASPGVRMEKSRKKSAITIGDGFGKKVKKKMGE